MCYDNTSRTALIVVMIGSFQVAYSGYGDPQDTLPSAFEREVHVMTNAVRMDPRGFRDTYISGTTILGEASYPAVAPLVYNQSLSRAARFHSVDMALNCGMIHESCDGTSWSKRVTSFYKSSSYVAENIATGKKNGLLTVIQWLRDDDPQGKPAADLSGDDGHRKNMMSATYKEIGVGYAYSASRQWNHFWTQDFGAGNAPLYKIPAGCHFRPNNTTLSFAANYYDQNGTAPKSTAVVIDNNVNELKLLLGSAAKGTYSYSMTDDKKVHCYYFIFSDGAGTEIRFPETAALTTGNELSCSSNAATSHYDRVRCVPAKKNRMDTPYFTLNGVQISGKLAVYRCASGVLVGKSVGEDIMTSKTKVDLK